jgi:hypothetical protein
LVEDGVETTTFSTPMRVWGRRHWEAGEIRRIEEDEEKGSGCAVPVQRWWRW